MNTEIKTRGRPRKTYNIDELKVLAVEYFNSTDKEAYLKGIKMSRTTLWRRLKEAGIQVKSQSYVL